MTIEERMVARNEREKDLLKYGRSQERERIIKLLEDLPIYKNLFDDLLTEREFKIPDGSDVVWVGDAYEALDKQLLSLIALIKGEK